MLFTFPSRYWFTIGRQGVLRLGGGSPHVQTGFHVSRPTQAQPSKITCTGLSPSKAALSKAFQFSCGRDWPSPRSLATTSGVSVDFLSSGYLDVSVPRVRLVILCIQMTIPLRVGFPIRTPSDQSFLAAPRGFSQHGASFIACICQGIP